MKTLVVLSALASIAIAAPSFLDYKNTLPENWADYTRRDKKSPHGYFFAESAPFSVVPPVHPEAELDSSSATGRSFGLKKPLLKPTIIKRPSGYHVYRDSAEERAQADPSEDCSKQVKVKFCNSDKTARSIKEDDMESSIKMAKEAIEHLQRDLKNIEHNPRSASWSERDTMHDDIEVARKALEHVHKNFGNLESMSLHSTLVDVNPSHQINNGKTHEERASQWKEHTESFKSNEGARNMEDIMKSAEQHESLIHLENKDTTKLMKDSEKMEHLLTKEPLQEITEVLKETPQRHANSETNKLSDMKPSESKMEHTHQLTGVKAVEANMDIPQNKLEEKNIEEENLKAKASELPASDNSKVISGADHHGSNTDEILRATKDHPQIGINHPAMMIHQIEPANSQDLKNIETNEHSRKSDDHEWNHETEKHLKQPKSSFTETQSIEHSDAALKSKHMKQEFEENKFTEEKKFGNVETSMKSAENENNKKMIKELLEESKNDKLMTPTHISSQKSAVSLDLAKDKTESHNMHWAPLTNQHKEETTSMKAATDFHKQQSQSSVGHHSDASVASSNQMDIKSHPSHGPSMKIHEHQHAMNHAKSVDDLNGNMSPDLKTSMIMDHAKSADFDGFVLPNLPSNLIDFAGKSAMDLVQWSHKSDGGRSAYGGYGGSGLSVGGGSGLSVGGGLSGGGLSGGSLSGGAGAGSGAVGVFPNAHVGGCAVPLLLSCSPSVVSGSLAKSGYGSNYGSAPAYRNADEFNFHNKRDTKKFRDVTNKKNIKQRTTILDKKL